MPEKTTEMILVKSKGFTLIELLVVIAIISLLVSILLPSLKKAQELAKRAVCSISLKNAGLAMNMYAEDSDGVFVTHLWLEPVWLLVGGSPYGINSLYQGGYLDSEQAVFCPEDEQGEKPLHWMPGYTPRVFYGYGYDGWANPATPQENRPFNPLHLGDVSNAAGTIAYSDKMYSSAFFYHEEGCNAVFMDGHAAWIPDQNGILKDWIGMPVDGGSPPYYGGINPPKAYKLMEYLAGNSNPELFPDYLNLPDADGYGL